MNAEIIAHNRAILLISRAVKRIIIHDNLLKKTYIKGKILVWIFRANRGKMSKNRAILARNQQENAHSYTKNGAQKRRFSKIFIFLLEILDRNCD